MPAALAAATRALEIDPGSAEAHNALACASLLWERDFKKAEREFLHALALNPKYIQARCWYGAVLPAVDCWPVRGGSGARLAGTRSRSAICLRGTVVSFALARSDASKSPGLREDGRGTGSAVVSRTLGTGLRASLEWAVRRGALAVLEALWAESPYNLWVAIRIVPTYAKVGRFEQGARDLRGAAGAPRARVPCLPSCWPCARRHWATMKRRSLLCAAAVEARDVLLATPPFVAAGPRADSRRSPFRRSHAAIQRTKAFVVNSGSRRPRVR